MLNKIKGIASETERNHKLHSIAAASLLMDVFKLDPETNLSILTQNILNLVEFENPRFLIQEV